MRITLVLLSLVLLGGCAERRVSECTKLAGPGWTALGQPPPEAKELLGLENLPADSELVWLSKGADQRLVCSYARGMTSPGCGGSVAYSFVRKNGQWASRGQLFDVCETGPD